jgi:hypothetical protein
MCAEQDRRAAATVPDHSANTTGIASYTTESWRSAHCVRYIFVPGMLLILLLIAVYWNAGSRDSSEITDMKISLKDLQKDLSSLEKSASEVTELKERLRKIDSDR